MLHENLGDLSVGFGALVREDLQSTPSLALGAAETALAGLPGDRRAQLDACLAALAAGEPKRALARLTPSHQKPRVTAALTAWARQLDGNWYPGDIAAETQTELEGAFVEARPGTPDEEILEAVVQNGPVGLRALRALLESSLRDGAATGAQQAAAAARAKLAALTRYATAHRLVDLEVWARIAAVDLDRRSGMPQAEERLGDVRREVSALGDKGRTALTYLVQGDWYGTPGSSPDALGWDLPSRAKSSSLPAADLPRAAGFYGLAEESLPDTGVPRLRAALALRRALIARASGDRASRRCHLEEAMAGCRAVGDSAGYHLAAMHALVCDIDEGRLGQHALDLGGGWSRPVHGPVADALEWAQTVGSRSWCVGLGRLLERCGDHWAAHGSSLRSRIGYLAALQLMSADPDFPSETLVTAVADGDTSTNALLRLERLFVPLFADTSTSDLAFAQKLKAAIALFDALRHQARGPAVALAADRLTLLGGQLAKAADLLRAALPPAEGPVPASHIFLGLAQRQIDTTDVVALLTRAEAAQRTGQLAEADRWFARALERAGRPAVDAYLLPLVLLTAERFDEARAALLARRQEIPDVIQLALWLRVKDYENAIGTLTRMQTAGIVPEDWNVLLYVAKLRLALGKHTEARQIVLQAIQAFEDFARLLVRDPERLEACDQPNVAALYSTLALTYFSGGDPPSAADADASFEAAELVRSLTSDSGPGSSDSALGRVDPESRQAWQHAAAAYSAAANRLMVSRSSASAGDPAEGFAALDALDKALATAEQAVDAQDPGILIRRSSRLPQPTSAQLRHRMPEGTLLLEYLAVGDDLLAWALTRDTVRPRHLSVPFRTLAQSVRTFHASCAAGHAHTAELPQLLLEPFADLLRAFPRLVVVPFGPLNLVPFHALPFDGAPLALSHVVSYTQHASGISELDGEGQHDRPFSTAHPLVVADPAFDAAAHPGLDRLPGSQCEARAVAQALHIPADAVLVDTAATEAAVGERIDRCDLLHVSSHGHLDELSPFASSLVLAGRDELTVADLSGLRFATDLAVLTGCDTGRGNATMGGDLIGLTRSLLRGGVRRTVVSLWPVDDWVTPLLIARFYAELANHQAPAYALAQAQRTLHGMSAGQMQAAYTALGGDPNANADRRRGLVLDPRLRDAEEMPEPLGGDAERYWAPFVLID
ncbi:CHAT domain-containing protein [Streptomyces sp. NPDC058655]|uniref:CHAT domain-containing protein n=1 Tax=Streptomyces sp. NPDC058655 TaxID=3346577 RepID=UPI00365B4818